ncbi:uncharacterized protein BDR25DRAFT_246320 [Lindgomyces ingoldianus]|uniref:Uncharacterized protein n=1 Tax=Lindgomyces ingoldianus TaxID=673940 RepID=A0ACB6Q990_9PLEO|nr:uncharacterized protein BDR25DRAFT_246320 [Lindgomyces ingoldianus]KAF2463148.1 hypothetical protein BDR25DRAFT_246320 [Lindgomyces ingoldianus]
MAKTKPQDRSRKSKKHGKNGASNGTPKKPKASPETLLVQAAAFLQTSQPDEALVHVKRALGLLQPTSKPTLAALPALNLLGEINVELGEPDNAREAFLAAVNLDEEGMEDGAEKFLWLAQLCEEGGVESVKWFEKGVEVLKREVGELEGKLQKAEVIEVLEEKKIKVANALCGIAEVYMTDLSWEEDAEARCEAAVTEALLVAPSSPEPLQTLASIRISQLRIDDAKAALTRSMELWKELDPDDPQVPDFSTRISLSRLLMEAEMEEDAIEVLERLIGENDSSVEAWYLGGWCLHLLAEKQKAGETSDTVTSLMRASLDWLENCLKLYSMLEYEDERLKDHASELLKGLNDSLGPSNGEEEEEEEWEDADDDGDEEMEGTTTEPPKLSPTHPIRRAFRAHGTATARHWLLSILLTIAISVLLCYPALFQTDSPAAAGLRSLPKHVWTSTAEVQGDRIADVEVRQVWVHGHYMNAIDVQVLRQALYVQNSLIRDGFGVEAGTAIASFNSHASGRNGCAMDSAPRFTWGFHTPLMYWNCSSDALEQDSDLLATINSRTTDQSTLNLTLRPSTVFAGKAFVNKKLQAADALVISLFDQTNSSLGATWDVRSMSLANDLSSEWAIFPQDGKVVRSRLYEFRFEQMSWFWDLGLALSYSGIVIYLILEIRKLHALKSWVGLLTTIGAKMAVCVIASFTLCTYLGLNLARVPKELFPCVVLLFGLGNIGRLIDEVLKTPPEMPPVQRIGNAVGAVGHLSLLVAAQNLLFIYGLSLAVTPVVVDFCIFGAVTLVLDLVYHFTFFLAVLSVEVQRLELQDSLERADLIQASKNGKQERQTWLGAFREGALPFSTRFAGSVAIVSLILALNWHFFDSGSRPISLRGTFNKLFGRQPRATPAILPWALSPINQARTPAEWLRIQDCNTAKELVSFIKPDAYSFTARVYDPLLVVLRGARGRDASENPAHLLGGLRRLAHENAFPAALIMVFLVAGVTLLMNYLLWSGLPKTTDEENDKDTLFSVKTLPSSQTLDIVRLTACPKGHLLTGMAPSLWPIVASTFNDNGSVLGLCSDSGQVGVWSLARGGFLFSSTIELRGHVPILFAFVTIHTTNQDKLFLIVVTSDGYLTEIETQTGGHHTKLICPSPILSATLFTCAKNDTSLVYVNKAGKVHILPLTNHNRRTSEIVAGLDPGPPPGTKAAKIKWVYSCSSLGLIFALRAGEAEIIDFQSRALIHTLAIGLVKPHSFRILHSARRLCPCGGPAVHSLSVAYSEQDQDHTIMQTFTLNETPSSQMCLSKPSDNSTSKCQSLDRAVEAVFCIEPAGVWESTTMQSVLGIRKCPSTPTPSSSASGVDTGYFTTSPGTTGTALKLRAKEDKHGRIFSSFNKTSFARPNKSERPSADSYDWEIWMLSTSGDFMSRPLLDGDELTPEVEHAGLDDRLFVASAGPITRLGKRSVAVGFGNTVKIITLGKESFDGGVGADDGGLSPGVGMYKSRPRKGTGRKTQ